MTGYAARNAILPPLTGFAAFFASAVGGLILVEVVFSYPGVGLTIQQAALGHDYPLVQALLLVFAFTVLARQLHHGLRLRHPRPAGHGPPDGRALAAGTRRGRAAAPRPARRPAAGDAGVDPAPAARTRMSAVRGRAPRGSSSDHDARGAAPDEPGARRARTRCPASRRRGRYPLGTTDQGYSVFAQVIVRRAHLARRRRLGDADRDDDRDHARAARRLLRRLRRRRDQPRHEHLPRHPDRSRS